MVWRYKYGKSVWWKKRLPPSPVPQPPHSPPPGDNSCLQFSGTHPARDPLGTHKYSCVRSCPYAPHPHGGRSCVLVCILLSYPSVSCRASALVLRELTRSQYVDRPVADLIVSRRWLTVCLHSCASADRRWAPGDGSAAASRGSGLFSLNAFPSQQEERPIRQILYLGDLLETCHFQAFWVTWLPGRGAGWAAGPGRAAC